MPWKPAFGTLSRDLSGKRLLLSLIGGITFVAPAAEGETIRDVVTMDPDGYHFSRSHDFDIVRVRDGKPFRPAELVGKPDLPILQLDYYIPEGMGVVDVSVNAADWTVIREGFVPMPIQRGDWYDRGDRSDETAEFTDPDDTVYDGRAPYPDRRLAVTYEGGFRGHRVLRVTVHPLGFIGADRQLLAATELAVDISMARGEAEHPLAQRSRQRRSFTRMGYDRDWFEGSVRNPDMLPWRGGGEEGETQRVLDSTPHGGLTFTEFPSLQSPPVEYIIVTSEELRPSFEELALWKSQTGMLATVRTVEWIRENYQGGDLPEQIRNFLIHAYEIWGTDFVLIGGDENVVPGRRFWTLFGSGEGQGPSDVYYAGLDGTWNKRRDFAVGLGFASDVTAGDPWQDVWVGRVPVRTTDETDDYLAKLFSYVGRPGYSAGAPGFHTRILAAAGLLNSSDWDSVFRRSNGLYTAHEIAIANADDRHGFDARVFLEEVWANEVEQAGTGDCYAATRAGLAGAISGGLVEPYERDDILNAISTTGYGLVYHSEHSFYTHLGGPSGCECDEGAACVAALRDVNRSHDSGPITSAMVNALTNGPTVGYPVVYSRGSYTNNSAYDAVSEHWLRNPDGGGVAFVGKRISSDPGGFEDVRFFEILLDEGYTLLGQTHGFNAAEAASYQDVAPVVWQLMGDPEMAVWTGAPHTFDPTGLGAIATLGPQSITVSADSLGVPVLGARVCLMQSDEAYAVGVTGPPNGNVTFGDFDVRSTDDLILTLAKPGFFPRQETITVAAQAPGYLTYDSHSAEELGASGLYFGNGNGRPEAGETLDLDIVVENRGETSTPVTSAQAELFSIQPVGIQVLHASVAYPVEIGEREAPLPQMADTLFWVPGPDGIRAEGEPPGADTDEGIFIWKDPDDRMRWHVRVRDPAPHPARVSAPAGAVFEAYFRTPTNGPGFTELQSTGLGAADNVQEIDPYTLYLDLRDDGGGADDQHVTFRADLDDWFQLTSETSAVNASIPPGGQDAVQFIAALVPDVPDRYDALHTLYVRTGSTVLGVSDFRLRISAPDVRVRYQTASSCFSLGSNACWSYDLDVQNAGHGTADTVRIEVAMPPGASGYFLTTPTVETLELEPGELRTVTGLEFQTEPGTTLDDVVFDVPTRVLLGRGDPGDEIVSFASGVDFVEPGDLLFAETMATAPGCITVRWDSLATAVTDEIVGYDVYRTLDYSTWERMNTEPLIDTTLLEDCGLPAATGYTYQVVAVDAFGNVSKATPPETVYTWPAFREGWPKRIPATVRSSPVVVDNGANGGHLVFVAADKVYAWTLDGDPYFVTEVFYDPGPGREFFAPVTAADLDGDGAVEILVADLEDLYCLNTLPGLPRVRFTLPDVEVSKSNIVVTDLDASGDGQLEVLVVSSGYQVGSSTRIYAVDAWGNRAFAWQDPNRTYRTIPTDRYHFGGVSVADLDDDGSAPEVVFSHGQNGNLTIFRSVEDGTSGEATVAWSFTGLGAPETYRLHKPAIGNIDGDPGLEIVVGQGAHVNPDGSYIHVLDDFPGGPVTVTSFSVPQAIGEDDGPPVALADLDDDGTVEAIIGGVERIGQSQADRMRLYVVDHDGGFTMSTCDALHPAPYATLESHTPAGILGGVAAGNIDGDASVELVFGQGDGGVHVVEWDPATSSCNPDEHVPWLLHGGAIRATPQLAWDESGDLALIVVDDGGRIAVYDLPWTDSGSTIEWAGFGNDVARTGAYAGSTSSIVPGAPPTTELLGDNTPNPFNPLTTIPFHLDRPGMVRLEVFDASGRRVTTLADGVRAAGDHHVRWDGTDAGGREVASGAYYYRLRQGGSVITRSMILLR